MPTRPFLLLMVGVIGAGLVRPPAGAVPRATGQTPAQAAVRVSVEGGSGPVLAALAARIGTVLDANRASFDGLTGAVEGFSAGRQYPQVWLRDSATLMDAARFLYPRAVLVSWLEEHLAHQRDNGQLYDWIAAAEPDVHRGSAPEVAAIFRDGARVLSADRNTTEVDQESSAIHAAHEFLTITNDADWLSSSVSGRRVLERLDAALEYVLREHFDTRLGLVTNAFTADWGDVGPMRADQRVIYVDDDTPIVAGLYTNAMTYRSARELAALHTLANDAAGAARWTSRAASLRDAIRRRLWQERAGFFRIHIPAGGPRLGFDDADIFALGGNALAIRAGLATPAEAVRIIDEAQRRHEQYRFATIGGVLMPAYPDGFFKHRYLAPPYTYQNGGQWDWFAGPFMQAEFDAGRSAQASQQLAAIAARVARVNGLYEWTTRLEGDGRGSPDYAASAGALGAAMIEGLFGIRLRGGRLDVRARACTQPAGIALTEPATGARVSYRCGTAGSTTSIEYDTSRVAAGRLCALGPAGQEPAAVTRGGWPTAFSAESVGEDRYACIDTDWGTDRVEVVWREARR
jgi:hypothetical protein